MFVDIARDHDVVRLSIFQMERHRPDRIGGIIIVDRDAQSFDAPGRSEIACDSRASRAGCFKRLDSLPKRGADRHDLQQGGCGVLDVAVPLKIPFQAFKREGMNRRRFGMRNRCCEQKQDGGNEFARFHCWGTILRWHDVDLRERLALQRA